MPRSILEMYKTHCLLLQAARQRFRFETGVPASIFVFKLQVPPDPRYQFEFRDSLALMAVSLRAGPVGILAALQDGRAQRLVLADELAKYQAIVLHPIQFRELTAMFFYKASLRNRVPKFITAVGAEEIVVVQQPLQGFSLKPIFDEWDHARYARLLGGILELPVEDIFRPPDQVMSWLNDEAGNPKHIDLSQMPLADDSCSPAAPL